MSVTVNKTDNSFRLVNLKGGETSAIRQKVIEESIQELETKSIIPIDISRVIWHRREQYKGKSIRYIAIGTDPKGEKWVTNITVGHANSFLEVRAFGPLERPCTKDVISSSSVPEAVHSALKRLYNVRVMTPSEARFDLFFEDDE